MPKICYLADASNPHVKKWCDFFLKKGYEIEIISLNGGSIEGVTVHNFQTNVNEVRNKGLFSKFSYLKHRKEIKALIEKIKPDFLHAQYASSYGFLGALMAYRPYILSVWGTDIYDFPRKGLLQKMIIKYNFKKADYIFSNSVDMAREANLYTNKNVYITYFGVDTNRFTPMDEAKDETYFTFGIVKSLEKKYGIKYLIEAYENLYTKYQGLYKGKKLRLLIGGSGQEEATLKEQVAGLESRESISFLGRVQPDVIVATYNSCDVCVFPSLREGFGVSAIESQACQVPVIITRVGGHPESVEEGQTGLIVESKSAETLLAAMDKLMTDDNMRLAMGKNARDFVVSTYGFEDNFEDISKLYDMVLENR